MVWGFVVPSLEVPVSQPEDVDPTFDPTDGVLDPEARTPPDQFPDPPQDPIDLGVPVE